MVRACRKAGLRTAVASSADRVKVCISEPGTQQPDASCLGKY